MHHAHLLRWLATVSGALLSGWTAAPAQALRLHPCAGQSGFSCGVLQVPLDHAGATPGTLKLAVAVQSTPRQRSKPLLVALSGGPGQGSVRYATGFAASLRPALSRYRLAVIDQRGTGSRSLDCPVLQRQGALDAVIASQVADCATLIGVRRAFYATRDSVEDLDTLRRALKAPAMALMGVSYGTYVAQQYARVHPQTTTALILDSIVGAGGIDPFLLDSYRRTPRVLREQCANRRCEGVTKDPVADLATIAAAVQGLHGTAFDGHGRARSVAYEGAVELDALLIAGDLNPFLQAAIPGALAAARRGDLAELLRLRAVADGGPATAAELSAGLNAATTCEDTALPYPLMLPLIARPDALQRAFAAVPVTDYAPFAAQTIRDSSLASDCLQWPQDLVSAPSTARLPDVPALLLSGRLDLRTPLENARTLTGELPRASIVRVPGTGHDTLDSDLTGCTATALARFVRGVDVGHPCRGLTNQVDVFPRPPRSVASFVRPLYAVLDSIVDARVSAYEHEYAGLPARGGGLRGGWWQLRDGRLALHRYSYVPELRVSGVLRGEPDAAHGTVDVSGELRGHVTVAADGSARGVLNGRRVRYRPTSGAQARSGRRGVRSIRWRARAAGRLHHLRAGRP